MPVGRCSDSPSQPLLPGPEGCPPSLSARYTGSQLSLQAGQSLEAEVGRTATAFWRSSRPQSHMGTRAPHRPVWGSQAVPVSKRTLGDKGGSPGGAFQWEATGRAAVLSSSSGPSTPASSCGVATLTTPTFARPRRGPPWMGPCVHPAR